MNRRNLVKVLTFLPFYGRLGLTNEINPFDKFNLSKYKISFLDKNVTGFKFSSLMIEFPKITSEVYEILECLEKFTDFRLGHLKNNEIWGYSNDNSISRYFKKYNIFTEPDPTKNIKLPSGGWLNVGENWEVKNIGDFKSKTNRYIGGYFDWEFDTVVRFAKYDGEELRNELNKMESIKGFLRGVVYNNGTDKFGILAVSNV